MGEFARVAVGAAMGAVLAWNGSAWADLFTVVQGSGTGLGGLPQFVVQHYSNAGANMGQFGSVFAESVDSAIVGPNGNVYLVDNTLGTSQLHQFNPVTGATVPMAVTPEINAPGLITALPNGDVLVPSTTGFSSQGMAGLLEFDGTNGNLVKVAVNPPSTEFLASGFNPADNKLYLETFVPAGNPTLSQYGYAPITNALTLNSAYALTVPTLFANAGLPNQLRFRDGDTSLYVGERTEIDRYSESGTFLGAFATAADGGAASFDDFVFGNDGYLYVNANMTSSHALLRYDASSGSFAGNMGTIQGDFLAFVAPEPGTCGVMGIGAAWLLRRRRGA